MTGRQEISRQQVMSYLVGGGDHYTSERFNSFNWGELVRYTRLFEEQVPCDADAHASIVGESTRVSITFGEDGSITASNQRLDYMYRPK
ncbi:hypothetical protein BKA70DRAFT_1110077 [Coprinopsis sp. MPI-PUGE-AT-0042]|nr:hypothetical protein BKA70DRAFT_1110077 [Coprinopsis sp. MPI-PUGE-AT-0042]